MSIKTKGIIIIEDEEPNLNEFNQSITNLPDGEYGYLVFDKKKSKALPQLKYLNGIVLKTISDKLPDHPSVDALYRFFEETFAPILVSEINGEKYEYFNLKKCKSIEMDDVIEKIIQYAKTEWDIDVMSRKELTLPEVSEPYANAYADQWTDYSRKI